MDKFEHEDVLLANRYYYNEVADAYLENESYAYTTQIKQDVKNIMTRYAALCPSNDLFLDIGCGSGFLSKIIFEEDLFKTAWGIDVSEKQVEMYNERFKAQENFNATVGDAANLVGIGPESVDMVAGYSVLHHFFDYHHVISECLRVLKPRGIAYFDFEPNFHFRKKWGLLVKLKRKFDKKSPSGAGGLEELAEFHNNYTLGIDLDSVVERFSDDIEVIENTGRFPGTPAGKILYQLRFMGEVSKPLFYFVIRKK